LYVPTRGDNSDGGANNNSVDNNLVKKDNNNSIDKPSTNKSNVDAVNISIGNNNGGVDKSNINKLSGINAKRAKFEEDVKKEPILKTILDVFDGELLS